MTSKQKSYIALALCLAGFCATTLLVSLNATVSFDSTIYNFIISFENSFLTLIAKFISTLGGTAMIIVILILLIIVPVTRRTVARATIVSVACSVVLNQAFKHIIQRPRPEIHQLVTETSFSFPSGHAMNNMALFLSILLFSYALIKLSPVMKKIYAAVLILWPIVIGLSRIYLGVHYPTDVIGGWLLGASIALAVYILLTTYDEWRKKKRLRVVK